MSAESMAILVLLASFGIMIFLRFPIAYAVALSSLLCLLYQGLPFTTICQQMVKGINSFSLMAVPFFITRGCLMGSGGISSPDMVDQILELSKNDDVKALVLRVNSPGGSAFGSEQMWEALETFKKTGKTFVVSMGDYAASGGYYISCGADRIFADPFTITGSIGIFGLIPNIKGLVDKIGLSVQTVATNPNGLYPAVFTPMDEQQLAAMQAMVEDGYNLFVKRVAEGRKLPVAKVKEVADGRPLSAVVARGHGLVDDLGSLQNAIDWAKKKAKVERENVVIYPKPDMNFVKLMGSINESVLFKLLSADDPAALGEEAVFVLQNMFDRDMVMARMYPFEVKL